MIWSLPSRTGAVALTFDDGPDPQWTPRVLDALAASGATASFFLLGGKASKHPELVERLRAAGHTVGSHAFSHRNLRGLRSAEVREEMRQAAATLAAITGEAPRWFRPPYGAYSPASLWECFRSGAATVLWNRDPMDYRARSAEEILARMGPLQAGDVVLMHDRLAATVEVLPEILARIEDAGLRAMSLDGVFLPPRHRGTEFW